MRRLMLLVLIISFLQPLVSTEPVNQNDEETPTDYSTHGTTSAGDENHTPDVNPGTMYSAKTTVMTETSGTEVVDIKSLLDRVKKAEERANEAEGRANEAQGQANEAQGRANEAQEKLSEAEKKVSELEVKECYGLFRDGISLLETYYMDYRRFILSLKEYFEIYVRYRSRIFFSSRKNVYTHDKLSQEVSYEILKLTETNTSTVADFGKFLEKRIYPKSSDSDLARRWNIIKFLVQYRSLNSCKGTPVYLDPSLDQETCHTIRIVTTLLKIIRCCPVKVESEFTMSIVENLLREEGLLLQTDDTEKTFNVIFTMLSKVKKTEEMEHYLRMLSFRLQYVVQTAFELLLYKIGQSKIALVGSLLDTGKLEQDDKRKCEFDLSGKLAYAVGELVYHVNVKQFTKSINTAIDEWNRNGCGQGNTPILIKLNEKLIIDLFKFIGKNENSQRQEKFVIFTIWLLESKEWKQYNGRLHSLHDAILKWRDKYLSHIKDPHERVIRISELFGQCIDPLWRHSCARTKEPVISMCSELRKGLTIELGRLTNTENAAYFCAGILNRTMHTYPIKNEERIKIATMNPGPTKRPWVNPAAALWPTIPSL